MAMLSFRPLLLKSATDIELDLDSLQRDIRIGYIFTEIMKNAEGSSKNVVVRRATLEDYRGVMDIDDNIYEGRDYLPYYYHSLVQNKYCCPYVLLVNGEISGFVNMLVMEDGKRVLSMASRIAEKHRGSKLFEPMWNLALAEVMKLFPRLEVINWTQVNHPRDRKYIKMEEVKLTWRLYTFDVDAEKIHLFTQSEPSVPVHRIKRLSLDQSARIFSDAATRTKLFPHEYFVALFFWCPFRTDEVSLKYAARLTDVTATFSVDGSTCESVAFTSLIKLTSGVRLDVWVYGSQVSSGGVLGHVYYWLRKSKHVFETNQGGIKLMVHFPLHVNKEEVRGHLAAKLGPSLVTSTFDSDEAICCAAELAPPAKL